MNDVLIRAWEQDYDRLSSQIQDALKMIREALDLEVAFSERLCKVEMQLGEVGTASYQRGFEAGMQAALELFKIEYVGIKKQQEGRR